MSHDGANSSNDRAPDPGGMAGVFLWLLRRAPIALSIALIVGAFYFGRFTKAENFCLRTMVGDFGCVTEEQAETTPERPATRIAGRGFYLDVRRVQDGQLEYYPAFENLEVLWDETENTVSGDSEGVVEVEGARRRVLKTWRQAGFKDNDFVVLSYFTSSEDGGTTDPAGVGTYFLRARGSYWIGYIAIWDSENGIAFQCPYVLVTGPSAAGTTIEDARAQWPSLYSDAACAPIPLLNRQ